MQKQSTMWATKEIKLKRHEENKTQEMWKIEINIFKSKVGLRVSALLEFHVY